MDRQGRGNSRTGRGREEGEECLRNVGLRWKADEKTNEPISAALPEGKK